MKDIIGLLLLSILVFPLCLIAVLPNVKDLQFDSFPIEYIEKFTELTLLSLPMRNLVTINLLNYMHEYL